MVSSALALSPKRLENRNHQLKSKGTGEAFQKKFWESVKVEPQAATAADIIDAAQGEFWEGVGRVAKATRLCKQLHIGSSFPAVVVPSLPPPHTSPPHPFLSHSLSLFTHSLVVLQPFRREVCLLRARLWTFLLQSFFAVRHTRGWETLHPRHREQILAGKEKRKTGIHTHTQNGRTVFTEEYEESVI